MTTKKRYAKKQIFEAIEHWSGVLARIDESKSKFLNACSKEFGEAVVFDDKDMLFEMNEVNLRALFKLLDNYFFASKLSSVKMLSIFIDSPTHLNKTILEYSNQTPVDLNEYIALYQPDRFDYRDANGRRISSIRKDAIFINTDFRRSSTFSYSS